LKVILIINKEPIECQQLIEEDWSRIFQMPQAAS
jgi:hypothetical protein